MKLVQEGRRPLKMLDKHLNNAEYAEFLQRVLFEYETLEKSRNKVKRGEFHVENLLHSKRGRVNKACVL